jgi:hypothetical protein
LSVEKARQGASGGVDGRIRPRIRRPAQRTPPAFARACPWLEHGAGTAVYPLLGPSIRETAAPRPADARERPIGSGPGGLALSVEKARQGASGGVHGRIRPRIGRPAQRTPPVTESKRIERRGVHGGKLTNTYDLTGLVRRLQELEPEFRQVEEEIKSRRRAVSRPGGLRRVRDASPREPVPIKLPDQVGSEANAP